MGFFEINRGESILFFFGLEYTHDKWYIFTIFYKLFLVCKIIFISVSGIGNWVIERIFFFQNWGIFLKDDIFPIIGDEYRMVFFYNLEKMTALEWDFFYEGEGIESQSYDAHPRKCSWSSNTPNSVDIMSIYEVMYMLGKAIIVFPFWCCRSMSNFDNFANVDDEEMNIFGERINKKNHF